MRKLIFSLITVCFFATAVNAQNIRIGLQSKGSSATISGVGLVATDAKGQRLSLGKTAKVKLSGKSLTVNGKRMTSPVTVESQGNWRFNKTAYSGKALFVAHKALTVAELVDIEEYLRGVLKMEVSPSWPLEALKAQAVISRTYAYRNLGRFEPLGFDLDDSVMSQVYRGVNAHDPKCDQAIRETRGMVLTYEGKPAQTFFHADSGGATTNVAYVWNEALPYLAGVPDPFPTNSRAARWKLTLSTREVSKAVAKMGKNVGTVKNIVIVSRDPFGRPNTLRFEGSKGKVTVKANQFRNAVGPSKLKSTWFGVNEEPLYIEYKVDKPFVQPQSLVAVNDKGQWVNEDEQALLAVLDAGSQTEPQEELPEADFLSSDEADETPDVPVVVAEVDEAQLQSLIEQGAFTKSQLIDMLLYPEKKSELMAQALAGKNITTAPSAPKAVKVEGVQYPAYQGGERSRSASGGKFTFIGRGTGHGVGLSQWETQVMATQGWKAEEILAHFYPGTVLEVR